MIILAIDPVVAYCMQINMYLYWEGIVTAMYIHRGIYHLCREIVDRFAEAYKNVVLGILSEDFH